MDGVNPVIPADLDRQTYVREASILLSRLEEAQERIVANLMQIEKERLRIDVIMLQVGPIRTEETDLEQVLTYKLQRVKELQKCMDDMIQTCYGRNQASKITMKMQHMIPQDIETEPRMFNPQFLL